MIFYIRRQGNGPKEPPDAQHFDNFTERKSYCKHHVWQPKKLQAKAIRTPTGRMLPRHRRDGNRSGRIAGQERPKTRPVRRISFLSFFQKKCSASHFLSEHWYRPSESIFIQRGGLSEIFVHTIAFHRGRRARRDYQDNILLMHFSDHIAAFIEAGERYRIVCPVYYKEECI